MKGEKSNPSELLLWTELTEIGRGTSSAIAKLASLGLAYFHRLEGFLPAGGEVANPLLVQYFAAGLGPDPGFPSAFDEGAPVLGLGHSWINLSEVWTREGPRVVSGGRQASAP